MQPPKTLRPTPLLTALAALLALALAPLPGATVSAQEAVASRPAPSWGGGFRLGLFDMTNAADSYDEVYGDPMPRLGFQLERQRGHLRYSLSLDYGTVDGERVLLGTGIGSGIDDGLTMIPVHFTAAWRFNPAAAWEWSAGLGPSFLSWENDGVTTSESGSDFGGSAVVALRRQGRQWDFAGELRWSTFPGALDDLGGVVSFFDEDDPGGTSLTLAAVRRF